MSLTRKHMTFNAAAGEYMNELEARIEALEQVARAVVVNVCMPMPGDYLYNPIEDAAMNALATLLEKQK